MNHSDIAYLRLHNQYISRPTFETPSEAVAWFGAVQAQDYLGALWAVGLRSLKAVEADIEQALADRRILRTWPMRGTLHFVASADAKWMLTLLAQRVVAANAHRLHRDYGLDEATISRSKDLMTKTLEGGKQMSRPALYEVLESSGIPASNGRGLHILSRLAHDGHLCFGAREGKQQTFTLLDEWAPNAKSLTRDEALGELALRYFTSHGPATVQDFVWWSGLVVGDARAGLEMARPRLTRESFDGQDYWLSPSLTVSKEASPTAYLLPPFDEYTVAYKDRKAVLNPQFAKHLNTGYGIFAPIIVIDGQVVGSWKRVVKKGKVAITVSPFTKFKKAESRAIAVAAKRYGDFLNAPIVLD
jgi:hypothetical protein